MAITLYEDRAEPNLIGARSAVQELKLFHDDVADRVELFISISAAGQAEADFAGNWYHVVHYTDGTSDPPVRVDNGFGLDAPSQTVLWAVQQGPSWVNASEPTDESDYTSGNGIQISAVKTYSHSELRYQSA